MKRAGLLLTAAASALATQAAAADWIITVGPKVLLTPPYEGAGNDVIKPEASFSIHRADQPYRFKPLDDGTTFTIVANRHFDLGPMVRFRYSRGDTGKLEGFTKVPWAAEPGAFFDVWPTNWLRGRIEGRRGVTGHHGWVADAGVDLIHTGHRWDASIGPRAGWGDRSYMDTYFGVTPEEAAASPYVKTPYEPGAGQRYWGGAASYRYYVTQHWSTSVELGYHRLAHKASDSPLVQIVGSPNQYIASVGVAYSFGLGLGH